MARTVPDAPACDARVPSHSWQYIARSEAAALEAAQDCLALDRAPDCLFELLWDVVPRSPGVLCLMTLFCDR